MITIRHTVDIDRGFEKNFPEACRKIGCEPLDLLGVIFSESGGRAHAHNPHGNASGIIQFMPDTLTGLGYRAGHAAFRHLTWTEQLRYVIAYFFPWQKDGAPWDSAGRIYQAVFLPGTLKSVKGADGVLCERVGKKRLGWAYEANTVLDANGDGRITVGELTEAVMRNARGPRWLEALARLGIEAPAHELRDVDGDGFPDVVTAADVQAALNRIGVDVGTVDGLVGPKTRKGIEAFQKRAGLDVDGIAGPKTRAALELAIKGATIAAPSSPTMPSPTGDPTSTDETVPSDTGDEVAIEVE